MILALAFAEAWARAGKDQPKTMSECVLVYRVIVVSKLPSVTHGLRVVFQVV